jgi:hypothetical protein
VAPDRKNHEDGSFKSRGSKATAVLVVLILLVIISPWRSETTWPSKPSGRTPAR